MRNKRFELDNDDDAPLVNNPKIDKDKEIGVSFRCSKEIKDKLVKAAKADDRSISWVIKKLITDNL
jgi:hypothetical protein